MKGDINRKLGIFSSDQAQDVHSLSCPGCQIFVKFVPAPEKARKSEKYLVTSMKIVPRGDVTEYWLNFLEHQSGSISDEQIRDLVRKAHQRGLYKSCQKIVSFIEYGDSDNEQKSSEDPSDGCPVQHRFNFMI